jgi:hypothetical protein
VESPARKIVGVSALGSGVGSGVGSSFFVVVDVLVVVDVEVEVDSLGFCVIVVVSSGLKIVQDVNKIDSITKTAISLREMFFIVFSSFRDFERKIAFHTYIIT